MGYSVHIREEIIPHAGMTTYAKLAIFSDRPTAGEPTTPLVVLHGGPGCTHDYLLSLTDLVSPHRPVLFYDQVGNGRSSHHPDAPPDFWNVDLFLGELAIVLAHFSFADEYDLLGQSWGGMLAAEHAVRRPRGLRKLVIANSPASMPLWREAALRLRAQLPAEVQETLGREERSGAIDSDAYLRASEEYYRRHVCRVQPRPRDVDATFAWLDTDPSVYHAMNGPTEFHVVGSLREWSIIDRLDQIRVPTLVVNGRFDEATDETVEPFVSRIPTVTHRRFESSSHMPHWEERDLYMRVVDEFLGS